MKHAVIFLNQMKFVAEYKVRPGQNFPMVKAVKNHMRHVTAYTLNMEEIIYIYIK